MKNIGDLKIVNSLKPLTIIGLCCFVISCVDAKHDEPLIKKSPAPQEKPVSEEETVATPMKGYFAIDQIVHDRLMDDKDFNFLLAYYITGFAEDSFADASKGLVSLLGEYDSSSGKSDFLNSSPNPVNQLLWHIIFDGFSKSLSSACVDPSIIEKKKMPLSDVYLKKLLALCSFEKIQDIPKAEAVLLDYWLTVMSYDAPSSEFLAWVDFLKSPEVAKLDSQEFVWAANMAIFFNPYFLLKAE